MTAFEVEARHIYRDGRPDIQRRPVTGPLLVERPGGTLLVDGLRLRTDVSGYEDDETPSTGDVVVMFLTAGPGDAWRLTRGPFGMFRVENTRLLQTREAAARRPDAPSDLAGLERWLGNAIK
jgi:hypothetical protein